MSDRPETALLSKTAVVVDGKWWRRWRVSFGNRGGGQGAVVVATVRQYKNRGVRKPPGQGRRASWSNFFLSCAPTQTQRANERGGGWRRWRVSFGNRGGGGGGGGGGSTQTRKKPKTVAFGCCSGRVGGGVGGNSCSFFFGGGGAASGRSAEEPPVFLLQAEAVLGELLGAACKSFES